MHSTNSQALGATVAAAPEASQPNIVDTLTARLRSAGVPFLANDNIAGYITPPEKRKNDGLYKVFAENFPIADTRNNFVLEFLDYYIDPPHYSIDECLERGLTYSVPLKAKLKLYCCCGCFDLLRDHKFD
jgi:DNA-directed RNA polymerase beta subunit